MLTRARRRILFWISTGVFIVGALPLVFYSLGYRFSIEKFAFLKAGALSIISSPSTGTRVFIDNVLTEETNIFSRHIFLQGLTPRTYSVRIEKDGYVSWEKQLRVESELVTHVDAFLIEKEPETIVLRDRGIISMEWLNEGDVIMLTDERKTKQYYSVLDTTFLSGRPATLHATTTLDDRYEDDIREIEETTTPKGFVLDAEEQRILWWSDHQVWVKWLEEDSLPSYSTVPVALIYETPHIIRSATFYPGHDALFIELGDLILFTELDGRGGLNTAPIVQGENIKMLLAQEEKQLFVLREGQFMSLALR